MTVQKGAYSISDEKEKLNLAFVHGYLTRSYWSENIPMAIIEKAISGSLCFGIYHGTGQVGFARVITDGATFAYLCDVFVIEEFRGKGLSKWLVETVLEHPELQGLRRFMLATRDAHGLYAQYGFEPLANADRWMCIQDPDIYKRL